MCSEWMHLGTDERSITYTGNQQSSVINLSARSVAVLAKETGYKMLDQGAAGTPGT